MLRFLWALLQSLYLYICVVFLRVKMNVEMRIWKQHRPVFNRRQRLLQKTKRWLCPAMMLLLISGCANTAHVEIKYYCEPLYFRPATIDAMQPDEKRDWFLYEQNCAELKK